VSDDSLVVDNSIREKMPIVDNLIQ